MEFLLWQFSLHFNFISIDYDLRVSFIILENNCFSRGKAWIEKIYWGKYENSGNFRYTDEDWEAALNKLGIA